MPVGPVIDITQEEIAALLERIKGSVSREDFDTIEGLALTVAKLSQLLQDKDLSIRRLRDLLFGASTEKTQNITGKPPEGAADAAAATGSEGTPRAKRKGHGRNGADRYTGAKKVLVHHPTLHAGDRCPGCHKGSLYHADPGRLVRVKAQPPLSATVTEQEKLRCSSCGTVFSAELPAEVGEEKYDATAVSMLALLKYLLGLPFYRIARMQASLGVPVARATQWDLLQGLVDQCALAAYNELVRQAAQGDVVHNDDTAAKILELLKEPSAGEGTERDRGRTGIFTTAIISTRDGRQIAVYFTDGHHAGESLSELLAKRRADLEIPIQMCDALSRNQPSGFATLLANCLTHGRRRFYELATCFPAESRYVLLQLAQVYRNDEVCKELGMSPAQRLAFHQAESGPVMDDLKKWLTSRLEEKIVEPNSRLGKAIRYMLKHWQPLTLFLRVENAPLDNNIAERALKLVILNRKNSLFFKTQNGAFVGDVLMSLIQTCNLCGANPFDYFNALQNHARRVRENPSDWMPWNYAASLAALDTS
ncbi:MAG: IS66 family transposase [Planctomycetota bacterium]